MDNIDIEKLLNDSKGYEIKLSDIYEHLITRTIANSFLSSEILKRLIALEQLIKSSTVDQEKVDDEFEEITKIIADEATAQKNLLIAELYLSKK